MGNLLREGREWLASQMNEHASEPIVYRREGENDLQILAVVGVSEVDQADGEGLIMTSQERDFIIQCKDLDFGNGPTVPLAEDEILIVDSNNFEHRFQVASRGFGGVFKYAGTYFNTMRIYTHAKGKEAQ